MIQKSIGGYFELELKENSEYHSNAISLNTGRNALKYILIANNYKKIYLPYFTCEVILQPIQKLNIEHEFYHINQQLEPIFDYSKIKANESFLYTNYFGLKDKFCEWISVNSVNLIIDNAQSFYSKPINNLGTFYSPRKFFGIPDGAYLFSNKTLNYDDLKQDFSFDRVEHLLKRIDLSVEDGYRVFMKNEEKLDSLPIRKMSRLTKKLLKSIDYDKIAKKRIENFLYLEDELKNKNRLKLGLSPNQVPLVYPLWTNSNLREKLLKHKIYTAKYWPNVSRWTKRNSLETKLTEEIVHLPIDQRQTKSELDVILKIIKKHTYN